MADEAVVNGIGSGTAASDLATPYPGPRPFRQTDQDHFFGRGTESRALAEFWQDNQVVLGAGPVACGKTSLLHAGVLPILTQHGAHVLPPGSVSHGAAYPSAALPKHNPYTLALLRSWSPGEAPTRLVDLTVREFIKARTQHDNGLLYAAIDQVDDLPAESGPRKDQPSAAMRWRPGWRPRAIIGRLPGSTRRYGTSREWQANSLPSDSCSSSGSVRTMRSRSSTRPETGCRTIP